MPLTILLALVIGGIAGIALLTWAMGYGQEATIEDEAQLRALWDADNPHDPARDALLGQSRRAGLIETATGFGVVWPMGADFATRPVGDGRIHMTRRGVRLTLNDYTAPSIRLDLTPAEAQDWVDRIERQSAWART